MLASDEAGKLFGVIAASEVEGLVLAQVRRLLASPELVARTITAVRREGEDEDAVLEEGEVIEALGAGAGLGRALPGRADAHHAAVDRAD